MVLDDAKGQQAAKSDESHDDERWKSDARTRRVAPLKAGAYKRRDHSRSVDCSMTIGTWLFTKMRGEPVGTDPDGNRYYPDKRIIAGRRPHRWVMDNVAAGAPRFPPHARACLHPPPP